MDLSTLKAQIKTGKFENYYIFTGPEIEVMRIYLHQMAKVLNADIKSVENLAELSQKLVNKSMLSNSFIYTLRESKEFISDDEKNAKITQNFASHNMPVVFIYTSIDKRSRVYKNCQDKIVEFEHLPTNILTKHIRQQIDLPERECERLIEICENDYSRILLEIDKIKNLGDYYFQFDDPATVNYIQAFHQLLEDGTIYTPPRDAVFMFVDAVLKNKPKLAFSLLDESYASGEATMILLSNLYNSTKQVLQVQSYNGTSKLTDATGLTPFQVKLASGRKYIYSDEDLIRLMKLTRFAEKGIKTGAIEDAMAVPYILVNLWQSN